MTGTAMKPDLIAQAAELDRLTKINAALQMDALHRAAVAGVAVVWPSLDVLRRALASVAPDHKNILMRNGYISPL
jgi:hypothetical protein